MQSVLGRRCAYELPTQHPGRGRGCGGTSTYSTAIGSDVASHGGELFGCPDLHSIILKIILTSSFSIRGPMSPIYFSWCFFLPIQDYEVHESLKQLLMSLLRAYRFSPIVPDLGLQVSAIM